MNKIIVLSLFDGLGGARIALDKLNIPCDYYASEIDKYAIQVSKKNYPDIKQLGDVTKLGKQKPYPEEIINGVDLIIFGSPCQNLSIARKNREGLGGEQSGLFFEAERIMQEIPHKYFVMENVNSMPKESKQLITEILGVEPIMINSSLLSAQNRKRLYWANIPGITQPEDKGILLWDILEDNVDEKYFINNINELNWIIDSKRIKKKYTQFNGDKLLCLMARNYASWNGTYINQPIRIGQIGKGGQGHRIYSTEGKSINLSASVGGRGAKTGLYYVAQRGRYNQNGSTSQQLESKCDNKTNTLTNVQKNNIEKNNIRKLTPLECERLQSIPDNYTEEVSDSQRYKMIGNGFTADVIKHILSFAKWE